MYDLYFDIITIGIYLIVSIVLSGFMIFYWSQSNCNRYEWYINVIVYVVFFITFFSVFLITVDLSSSLYAQHLSPYSNGTVINGTIIANDTDVVFEVFYTSLYYFWQGIYWVTWVLTWLVVPFYQAWLWQGHFNFFKKVRGSIIDNAIYYGICGLVYIVVLVAFVIYIVVDKEESFQISLLFVICISLSNAFGYFKVYLLLGFGFASLPLRLFRMSSHKKTLKYLEFSAPSYHEKFHCEKDELHVLLCNLKYLNLHTRKDDPKKKNLETIIKRCGNYYNDKVSSQQPEGNVDKIGVYEKLHKDVIKTIRGLRVREYQWKKLYEKAFFIEDIINSKEKKIKRRYAFGWLQRMLVRFPFLEKVEWVFYKVIWKYMCITLGVITIIISMIIMWCLITPIVQIWNEYLDFSILSLAFRLVKSQRWLVQIMSLVVLLYFIYVLHFAVFQIKVFEQYKFIRRYSDAYSMLFAATFVGRIIPCVLFVYLNMIGVTQKDKVSFFNVMAYVGNLKALRWLWFGEYVSYFLPCIVPVVVICVVFDLFGRLGSLFGLESFVLVESFLVKNSKDTLRLGKKLFKNERRTIAKYNKELIVKEIKLDNIKLQPKNESPITNDEFEKKDDDLDNDDNLHIELDRHLSDISSDEDNEYLPSNGNNNDTGNYLDL